MSTLVVAVLVCSLMMAGPAYAYLDPGSGSMMLQLLLGGIAGLFVIFKLYWRRLLMVFGVGKKKKSRK